MNSKNRKILIILIIAILVAAQVVFRYTSI